MKFLRLTLAITVGALLLAAGCKKAEEAKAPATPQVKNDTPVKNTPPASAVLGERITILANALPPPFDSGSATNPPKTIPAPPDAHRQEQIWHR